jgi:hypothetical protein
MKQWKQWESDQCPRCGNPEDSSHVWLCQDQGARDIWSKAIAAIELTLRKLDTEPTILHLILVYLNVWSILMDGKLVLVSSINPLGFWRKFCENRMSLGGTTFTKGGCQRDGYQLNKHITSK